MASVSSTRSNDSYEAERASTSEKHERNLEKLKEDEEKTLLAAKQEYQERLKDLKKEANEEVRKLKEDSYDSHGRRFANLERDNIQEKGRLVDAYEAALAKSLNRNQEQENVYEDKLGTALNDANERSRAQVQTQKAEFVRMAEEKRMETEQTKKYLEGEIAKERMKSEKNTTQVIQENNTAIEKAMHAKNEKYNEYLKENHHRNQLMMEAKDKELMALKHTDDPTKVSPEARKKVEDAYYQRFSKDLAEERRVNAANTEALKNRNSNYQQNIRDGYSKRFGEMSQDLRERHLVEKQTLVKGYDDLENFSEQTKMSMQDRHQDQAKRTYQKHSSEMSLQEERSRERLKDQRAVLIDDKLKTKAELESKQRAQEREVNYKLTDLRRSYEKKILDQKDLHEKEMSTAKFEFDKRLQEQQRSSKKLLEERVKAYEAQLSQQESMSKEHSRLLTEHFEEELDKLKRTNARITQTKS
jgi:hypothetical protein